MPTSRHVLDWLHTHTWDCCVIHVVSGILSQAILEMCKHEKNNIKINIYCIQ